MTKIQGGSAPQLNPSTQSSSSSAGQAAQAQPVGKQIQGALFGRPRPPILDPAQFPALAEQLRRLQKFKRKLASMAGDGDDDYELVLADGAIAMIDEQGRIYLGAGFLAAFERHPEVLIGAMAHEIGHRPKRWREYRERRELSQQEILEICRQEEIRADIFAGKALAELGLSSEPLADFLKAIETGPHPDYLPAVERGRVLADAHAGREYRARGRRSIFPGFDRMTSPKGHLGEF